LIIHWQAGLFQRLQEAIASLLCRCIGQGGIRDHADPLVSQRDQVADNGLRAGGRIHIHKRDCGIRQLSHEHDGYSFFMQPDKRRVILTWDPITGSHPHDFPVSVI
jgi:hypothetical protein